MASSPRSNFCSRTSALKALFAVFTSAKAKFTRGELNWPLFSAAVFGFVAKSVCKVNAFGVSSIGFALLFGSHGMAGQCGVKGQRRLGKNPFAVLCGEDRQTFLRCLQEFRECSFRGREV